MSTNATTLTELLIRERPALLRLVQRILGSDSGAEDVIQSIWFKARGVDSGQPISNPRAYLYRLAANLATDHGRERTRRTRLLAEHYLWGPEEAKSRRWRRTNCSACWTRPSTCPSRPAPSSASTACRA
jgi:DNA-directed RNA polymerase specialized sigma24 family protein